jgi:hypothetical protein
VTVTAWVLDAGVLVATAVNIYYAARVRRDRTKILEARADTARILHEWYEGKP